MKENNIEKLSLEFNNVSDFDLVIQKVEALADHLGLNSDKVVGSMKIDSSGATAEFNRAMSSTKGLFEARAKSLFGKDRLGHKENMGIETRLTSSKEKYLKGRVVIKPK